MPRCWRSGRSPRPRVRKRRVQICDLRDSLSRRPLGGLDRTSTIFVGFYNANHIAYDLFFALEGGVQVYHDTIIVTYYNAPNADRLRAHYEALPERFEHDGISPRIPWLFNYKPDFRFR